MKWLIILVLFSACSVFDREVAPGNYSIEYIVSGTGACTRADLTYYNSSEGISQQSDATLPWSYKFTVSDKHQFLYISAQNDFSSGSVTTTIKINGTVEATSTSTGAYVISTSSGSVYSLQ